MSMQNDKLNWCAVLMWYPDGKDAEYLWQGYLSDEDRDRFMAGSYLSETSPVDG